MPYVNIRLVKEVIEDDPEGKKQEITRRVASAISETTGLPEDAIWVLFDEVSEKDWFVGSNRVKELRGS